MERAVTDPLTTALVTGAGRDREIGTAVCRALAAAGHRVVFTVPPGGDGSALAAELGARALEADLAAPGAAAALLDAVGPVGVLVNNAAHGVNAGYASLDEALLDVHYAVNVRTPVMLTCELARRHPPGTPGRVVCLTSGQSLGPMPGEIPYATTKGALETFVRQVAHEVMPLGITVNAVNPGVTDTGWIPDALRPELVAAMPAGRLGEAEDAARLIAWLCSADAAWVTGQVIASEGGFARV
jgi:3-oxoacyl-[acyl-carrier protein] reductase